MQKKMIKRRANGGYMIHLVDPVTQRALCGHRPKNKGQLFHRAGWRYVEPIALVTCKGCLKRSAVPDWESA